MGRFDAKVVIVTGGSSGIGRATVDALLDEGALVYSLDRDPSSREGSDSFTFIDTDVRVEEQVTAAIDSVATAHGRIDVLINAAGIELVSAVEDTTLESWDRVLDTNLRGYFLTIRAALPWLKRSQGSIVNVASQLALVGARLFSAYTSSKSAVLGLTRSVALECAASGVRVNAICPGAIDTPLLRRQFADGKRGPQGTIDDLVGMHPLGRLGEPREIARPILFLASAEASFMTGSIVVVDGGYTA